ncbi:phosphatidylinositol 4-phosphate 5-kinase 5-like [Euphorbia lathyris]|uniref:phosphatidylinositol 4-phosphate 5-kinase 5-like n=1 Tax=Euphorbia lathyris TaxID=212925 RepID=UPI003314438D
MRIKKQEFHIREETEGERRVRSKETTMASSSSSSLSRSATLSNFNPKSKLNTNYHVPISIKTLACKIRYHLGRVRLFCVHLRVLVIMSLPCIYLFISYPGRFFILNLFSMLAFSITLVVSINLALPRLPCIGLFLGRSLASVDGLKESKPVIWSIGSKAETEKKQNSGCWVQAYRNGDVYEGEFHKGKCSGSGVYYYSMSGRYEGDWIDDKYDGFGVETWAKGSRYRGQYREGLRHGIGVYRFYAGHVYSGEWSNGYCHGTGIYTCEDGSKYVGHFKTGLKHGFGHYHFRNGDTYAGEYFADKMHGFGVYQFGNGHRYEGAWHEGKRQGLGMYTFRNGELQSGHWQNGILDNPTANKTQSGFPFAVTGSKLLNSVQEARRAAEKAYEVTRVEERVNRTVAGANKAATAARVSAVKAVQRTMTHN